MEKVGSDGKITRKKVRVVAKGFMEVWGEDYIHMYLPTLGHDTLFTCLTYTASCNLKIHQLNAVAAYLNSDLTGGIYLHPPDGIRLTPGMVWQLRKALYGLKQAGLEWFRTLHSHIQSIGYAQSGHDPCLYILNPKTFVLVYIDDLVFTPKLSLVRRRREIARCYEMHDPGEAHWFLAMEITHDWTAQTISIDQHQYIWKIISCFELGNAHLVSTPMATNLKLPKLESPAINQKLYQSMLGSLMYVVIGTCPNIMFAVHYLSQHSIAPGNEHLNAMKQVYCYLVGTPDLSLIFFGNQLE